MIGTGAEYEKLHTCFLVIKKILASIVRFFDLFQGECGAFGEYHGNYDAFGEYEK